MRNSDTRTIIREVSTINVPWKVGSAAWAECLRRSVTPGVDFIGMNEVFTRQQKSVLAKEMGHHMLAEAGLFTGPNPLFFCSKKYGLVESRNVLLHGRGPQYRTWPGFNERRYANDCALRDKRTGEEIGVIVTHLVPQPGKKVQKAWRAVVMYRSRLRLNRLIKRHLRVGRNEVWVLGDTNEPGDKPNLYRVKWVRPEGIDKIGLALRKQKGTAKVRMVRNIDWALYQAPTDHKHGLRAWYRLVMY